MGARVTHEKIRDALELLPNDFRQAVVLADLEGLSYKEIADLKQNQGNPQDADRIRVLERQLAEEKEKLDMNLILVQALFGKWTVTLKLKPIIVTTHLIGGMTTLSLLLWFLYRAAGVARLDPLPIRRGFVIGGIVLVAIQIALGGWVSANYAALACGTDWPKCLGQWWPPMDARDAFVLWRGIGVDYEGGVLDGEARTAIQVAHRLFAVVVIGHLLALGVRVLRMPGFAAHGVALLGVLALQVGLGIANVVAGLPLWVATGHNFGAALLLAVLIGLLARVTPPPAGLAPARATA